ncbi:MAG: Lyzozyme M1 (1,4-beta-N-acetylmuramidase), partial [Firmicutes bacterium]|nr:Lyzozyme M1 (1,4-beta-N-acetylmuramidase) [Bacillota bacterium]MBR6799503.1 Lyzozyme M1 (1,4-beta-N-acetylmuramidase) [Bacillota bacterium]
KIYRATSKNGKYKCIKTIKTAKTVTFTNKSLKKGKKYYYKVRAYKKVSGKYKYSSYSTVKYKKAK